MIADSPSRLGPERDGEVPMSAFEENVVFIKNETNEERILHFQLMRGGHEFHIDNLYRFGGFMAFDLNKTKKKSKFSFPLLINTAIGYTFDLLAHKRYIFWLTWNHVGYLSWKYSYLSHSMTTSETSEMAPIPDHISSSIVSRYGPYEYCRYFEYGGENLFKVYWVVLEKNGQIVIAEETDSWIGRWGKFLDVTLSPAM